MSSGQPAAQGQSAAVVLTTLNARYIHSAFGLRYSKANLQGYEADCEIKEFGLDIKPEDAVEQILSLRPRIVGFGVYIWNIEPTERIVKLLKRVAPDVKIVVGGPEVSYETESTPLCAWADYVITGWGEVSFYHLVDQILIGNAPENGEIVGIQPPLSEIKAPYHLYTEEDIAHRLVYVEASRGCPFKCEFCLSALDKTAWPFALDAFLDHLNGLYERGVRTFKFVDRTFNLKVSASIAILDFFLARLDEHLFIHFEVIPDHLPEALKEKISQFPAGCLQFEIGIQTFNPDIQQRISRRQDNEAVAANLRWLRAHSSAYIHADLIYGLPGEDLNSFAQGFDALVALDPHEIQVGILKRLKGSPITRHTDEFALVFNPNPPYNVVQTSTCSFAEVQQMNRFARYWDLLANSGRFRATLPLLLGSTPFERFCQLTRCLYERTGRTHKLSLLTLMEEVYAIAIGPFSLPPEQVIDALTDDHARSGLKSLPTCLQTQRKTLARGRAQKVTTSLAKRQQRRL